MAPNQYKLPKDTSGWPISRSNGDVTSYLSLLSPFPDTFPLLASVTSLSQPLPGLSVLFIRLLLINLLIKQVGTFRVLFLWVPPNSICALACVAPLTPHSFQSYIGADTWLPNWGLQASSLF